ncbi:multiple sugar transport system permease protein [Alkalihalobacillus xiaoxiensis]|uniref:Multiple sugar transport system permease protein n=1 Tax=Shouchella xiaoxiensis TaxID=766895 RepID=A0ABS2SS63_9BACI|nr:carbohydrate ABC transporter permease [Shouchella xiaoxiensis]MBM7837117.1 multiple sugar transport system permease protein [Shouchella xiaoxiensis]
MTPQNKDRLLKAGLYAAYFFIIVVFLFPLFWVGSISLKTQTELFAVPPSILPSWQFENYWQVLQTTPVLTYLWNSFRLVILTVIFTLVIALPAAFALSRFKMRGKSGFLLVVLMTQMISAVVIAIPLYRLFASWDLLNNFLIILAIYVAVVLPLATWFMKNYFDTLPEQMDEAAIIDGCTKWQLLTKILIPVARPGIISVVILVSVQSWSQFVIPFILIDDAALYPVSVGVVNLQSTQAQITTHYLAAGSIMSIVPVIILFLLLQKYIVGALTSGAVKG